MRFEFEYVMIGKIGLQVLEVEGVDMDDAYVSFANEFEPSEYYDVEVVNVVPVC